MSRTCNGVTETGTVHVLVVHDGGRGGALGSRDPSVHWAKHAGPRLRRSARYVVEWVGDVGDLDGSREPAPPETVDVITRVGVGLVRVRLGFVDGAPSPVELEVHGAELTARHLRKVGMLGIAAPVLDDWAVGNFLGSAWSRSAKNPGRAGRSDAFYAEWAQRYVSALEEDPARPVDRIVSAELAAGGHATHAQVKAYVARARARDMLTAASPGKPGGRLTSKARRLLDGAR